MLIAFVGMLSSCSPSLVPYTEDLHSSYDWSESDLQRVQFYLSNDIVLFKESGKEGSQIIDGDIKLREGRKVEKIVFKKGTPGVLLFTHNTDRFAVSFEDGEGSSKFLMFGPSDKANGRFVLLAKKWKKGIGKITYDDKVYSTPSESAYASLLVNLKKARKVVYESKKVGGRTITE